MVQMFVCKVCGESKLVRTGGGGTGYASRENGDKVCYACCADEDRAYMREHGKIMLYLGIGDAVSNWSGTLIIRPDRVRRSFGWGFGRAYRRVDVWFSFEGATWYGRQQGDFNQVLHCRRIKAR